MNAHDADVSIQRHSGASRYEADEVLLIAASRMSSSKADDTRSG